MDIGRDKTVEQIISRLKNSSACDGPVKVEGTWGSFAPALAAEVFKTLKRPILYISAHIDDADNVNDDLLVFGHKRVQTFPAREDLGDINDATDEISSERLRIVMQQWQSSMSNIISTSIQALIHPIPKPQNLEDNALKLGVKTTIEMELVLGWLTDNMFERTDRVDMPGQFAQRGGIVDIYAPVLAGTETSEPVRIEFFGDTIESIRRINLDTQRSCGELDNVDIVPAGHCNNMSEPELFINILPKDAIIILAEPVDIQEVAEVFLGRVENSQGLYDWSQIYEAIGRYSQLHISRFASSGESDYLRLNIKSTQQYEHRKGALWAGNKAALAELAKEAQDGKQVLLYCENAAEVKRITEILQETVGQISPNFTLPIGFVHQGFVMKSINTIVVTHHELFGQYAIRRRIRAVAATSPIDTFLDLNRGDYVVHLSYGIGKFKKIEIIEKQGQRSEFLTIEYADKVLIHVPIRNIHLVQKYVGALPRRPQLSKIGTNKWEQQKKKVATAVADLAEELLELQARRESMGGIAFEKDSTWQREFEESFLYQETPDQIKTMEEIKSDMQTAVAMDRLLCGDVGYGKTELAMRAAFNAIEGGKQVAVLVPTTVLCVQHGRTFSERFADFPITVETLNRFRTAKEAKDITKKARQGKIDILIGTHRLLSKDVGFKDLGLLVIDEEQRFGVEHKEKLKRLRANVDILTMTATPIPRTLHLSLMGLRNISSLATPPMDRRSVVTNVRRYSPELIKKAILFEMNRQGQVFFLHNRVQSIEQVAEKVSKLVPQAKVDIGHGQMPKHKLESAMINFVLGRTDVLVCSTIIESGLDIPNANTIIINDADRFGLAQLHQLRGRVGRFKHRAYAYMLLPITRTITPIAAKRLKVIEDYSQLGAGFRIALRDLEIRGAGNILGAQQSGHINVVGYELFCKLLSDTVKRLKNEPVEQVPMTVIDLGFSTYIPKDYIPSDRQRMGVYRQIAGAQTTEDLERLGNELTDLFGHVADEVGMLIDMAELRILAAARQIKSITISGRDLIFVFDPAGQGKDANEIFERAPGIVRIPDSKTVHIRLEKNYFEPNTLMSILRKMLRTN